VISQGWRRTNYHTIGVVQWAAGIAAAVMGASLKADAAIWTQRWEFAGQFLKALQGSAWYSLPLLTCLLGIGQVARSSIGHPRIWFAVKQILDIFRDDVFAGQAGQPLHHHRVTLFKHKRFRLAWVRWPWSGWLVAVERSGHTTRTRTVAFRAPDNADLAEGIAGQTWATRFVIAMSGLPDPTSTDNAILTDYANRTFVPVEWVRARHFLARSYCGIPVEVKGRVWGVIVLDSRGQDSIDTEAVRLYTMVGKFLGKLLERA